MRKMAHRVAWLKAGRKIPQGHVFFFKDGNPKNSDLENLEVISKAEHLRRIKVKHLPYESSQTSWTEKEDKKLEKLYRSKTAKEIAEILGRTLYSVHSRAAILGLNKKHPVWTQEMDIKLILFYPDTTTRIIAEGLGKTIKAVIHRAKKLGLSKESVLWTPEEDAKIKKLYPKMKTEKLAEILRRTPRAVAFRAYRLGVEKIVTPAWTLEHSQFLIKNYQKMTNSELGEALGKSLSTISHHAKRLGLRKTYKWTPKEKALFMQIYPEMTAKEVAYFLNKSKDSVQSRVKTIKKEESAKKKRKRWTKGDDWALKELYPVLKIGDIARYFGRAKCTIYKHIKKLELYRLREPSESELLSEFKYKWLLRHFTGIELIPKETYGTKKYLLDTVKKGDYKPRPRREPTALALALARAGLFPPRER